MWIVSLVLAALVGLLVLHQVVLPLSKRRAVLFRGKEAYATVALIILSVAFLQPWWLLALLAQFLVWWAWRPWLIIGLTREQLRGAIRRASSMVRMPAKPSGQNSFDLAPRGSIRVTQLIPGVNLYIHRVKADKKFILFQNVLRKTVQNFTLGLG